MQVTFDLFGEPTHSTPTAKSALAASQPEARAPIRQPHPFGAPKTRARFREELQAANVAIVKFEVESGAVIRVSQFIPAGNQCIGLYPEPLKAIGQGMLEEIGPLSEPWTGVIEWDVAADQPRYFHVCGTDAEAAEQTARPRA